MNFTSLTSAPSGCFAPVESWLGIIPSPQIIPVDVAQTPVFNPGVLEMYRERHIVLTPEEAGDSLVRKLEYTERQFFTASDLAAYSATMIKITSDIAVAGSNCQLAPLRGALRPAALVNVMSNRGIPFDHFDFRRGSDRVREGDSRLFRELKGIIDQRNPGTEAFKILTLDVVKGGQGSKALLSLLHDLKESSAAYRSQHWLIDLRLLHSEERPWMRDLAREYTRPRFIVSPTFYPVTKLVGEDYDEGLSYLISTDDGEKILKPTASEGEFLLQDGDSKSIIRSPDIGTTIDEFLSTKITEDLITDPARHMVSVVWDDYTKKG